MWLSLLKKHRNMILASLFFFYLGCGITLNLLRVECSDGSITKSESIKESLEFVSVPRNDIQYAVLILSSPDNEAKRDSIRSTWANFVNNIIIENGEKLYRWNYTRAGQYKLPNFVKFYYAIGVNGLDLMKYGKLSEEDRRTNDLLLLTDVKDSYKNLATKLKHSLKWLNDNLSQLRYVVKCDDDSFVRIDLVIRDLEVYAPEMSGHGIEKYITAKKIHEPPKALYWGYFDGKARVYFSGKWQEQDWFLCDNYLPYAIGGGYVISQSIVNFIARNIDILSCYTSEDVSMGVWTAALDGINRVHDTRFDTEWTSRGCHNDLLVRHKQAPSDMFEMFNTLVRSQGKKLCKIESSDRTAYFYKWHVLPSKCCR